MMNLNEMYYDDGLAMPKVGTIIVKPNVIVREVISVDKNNITLRSIKGYNKKIDKIEWNKIITSQTTTLFQKTTNIKSGIYKVFCSIGNYEILIKKISDKKVQVFSSNNIFNKQYINIKIKKQNWKVFEMEIDELLSLSFLLEIQNAPYLDKKIYFITETCKKRIKKFVKNSGIKKTEEQIIRQLKMNILQGETKWLELVIAKEQNSLYTRQYNHPPYYSDETIIIIEDEDFKSKYVFPKLQNIITLNDTVRYIGKKEKLKEDIFKVEDIKSAFDNPKYDEVLLKNKKTSLIVFKHEIKKIKDVQNINTIKSSNTQYYL